MFKFRKKPVEIEAFQMTEAAFNNDGGSNGEWPRWAQEAVEGPVGVGSIQMAGMDGVACRIMTLEGQMDCNFNDWIIRGIKGELYPCKPDIFAATYDPVV